MALQGTDLLVVQSQADKGLYKLRIDSLDAYLEGSSGVQFRGSIDLNNSAAGQSPNPITLPAANGDLYIVESDANPINADWVMETGVTSANENDRVIWDANGGFWVLVAGGSSTGGLIETITTTKPLDSDNDPTNPVLSIDQATTADPGAVARLATNDDVKHTDSTGNSTAVVTADLLKATNDIVEGLATSAGGVQTVTTTDADGNGALTINQPSGNVVLEIKTAADDGSAFGVVEVATASDITAGTAGAGAVVDASQLKAVSDAIPAEGLQSLSEGGTDIVAGALEITTDASNDTTIGVVNKTFAPFDFSGLTDITD